MLSAIEDLPLHKAVSKECVLRLLYLRLHFDALKVASVVAVRICADVSLPVVYIDVRDFHIERSLRPVGRAACPLNGSVGL